MYLISMDVIVSVMFNRMVLGVYILEMRGNNSSSMPQHVKLLVGADCQS
jgi:hypothetical protein